jgi:hypothetical protein
MGFIPFRNHLVLPKRLGTKWFQGPDRAIHCGHRTPQLADRVGIGQTFREVLKEPDVHIVGPMAARQKPLEGFDGYLGLARSGLGNSARQFDNADAVVGHVLDNLSTNAVTRCGVELLWIAIVGHP